MTEYKVDGHQSSFLPEGRKWKLIWNDEFDGTELDRTKWDFRTNYWGEEGQAFADEKAVRLDGKGNIELHRIVKDGYYISPQLQTGYNSFDEPKKVQTNPWEKQKEIWPLGTLREPKFMHRFGYYECRCKFQREPEIMWSAFWTQSPSIGAAYDASWCGVESDIMECFKKGTATTGNIMDGYGKRFREEGRVYYPIKDTADGYHTFAMDWTAEHYIFYCDGEVVSEVHDTISQVPQFILLTTEVQGWRQGTPVKAEDGAEEDFFTCDYVRVFDEVTE